MRAASSSSRNPHSLTGIPPEVRQRARRLPLERALDELRYYQRFYGDLSPRTVDEVQGTVRLWTEHRPGVLLEEIDDEDCLDFASLCQGRAVLPRADRAKKRWESGAPGTERQLSMLDAPAADAVTVQPRKRRKIATADTLRKHLACLRTILTRLGPRGPWCWEALEVLDRVPYVRLNRVPEKKRPPISDLAIARLYAAAEAAQRPGVPGMRACWWWQALMVCAYNLGYRRGALLRLTWKDVDLDYGLVRVPASIDKAHKERTGRLHPVAVAHLRRLFVASGRCPWVFPWDNGRPAMWQDEKKPGKWICQRQLYREWELLQNAAGFSRAEHFRLHDFRNTSLTVAAEASDGNAWLVKEHAGHSTIQMSEHYIQDARAARGMEDLVKRFPQPAAFLAIQSLTQTPEATAG